MASLEVTPELVSTLKAYFRLTAEDEQNLGLWRGTGAQHAGSVMEQLYSHYLKFPETISYFPDDQTLKRVRDANTKHVLSLFGGRYDEAFFEEAMRVGEVHDRINVLPRWYTGAYAFLVVEFIPMFAPWRLLQNLGKETSGLQAFMKVVFLDLALAWEKFYISREERLERRIKEISALSEFTAARVNELIKVQEEMEERNKQLSVMLHVARVISEAANHQEAAESVLDKVIDLMGVEAGEIFALDEVAGEMVMVAHRGLYPQEFRTKTRFKAGEGYPGFTGLSGQPFVTQDLASHERFLRTAVKERGFRFYACVPVQYRNRVVGTFSVASLRQQPWDDSRTTLFTAIGNLLGRSVVQLTLDGERTGS